MDQHAQAFSMQGQPWHEIGERVDVEGDLFPCVGRSRGVIAAPELNPEALGNADAHTFCLRSRRSRMEVKLLHVPTHDGRTSDPRKHGRFQRFDPCQHSGSITALAGSPQVAPRTGNGIFVSNFEQFIAKVLLKLRTLLFDEKTSRVNAWYRSIDAVDDQQEVELAGDLVAAITSLGRHALSNC